MCSNWISLPERSSIAQLPFRLASSPRPVTLAEGCPITMIFSELNESFNLSVVPVKSILHYFTQFHVFKTTYWLWWYVWNVMWKKGQYVVVMMTMAMMVMMVVMMMVIMIVILGTWRCDRWSRSIYSMLTVTCTDHIIIQWWKSKWQGPAPLSCGIGDSSCWMNPHHNMTQTNQDVLLICRTHPLIILLTQIESRCCADICWTQLTPSYWHTGSNSRCETARLCTWGSSH